MINKRETATPENNGSNFYSPELGRNVRAKNQKEAVKKINKLKTPKK